MKNTIILSIIGAAIGAFIGYLKLVSDNEGRITDFRREWNESLRKGVSQYNANILAIWGRIDVEGKNLSNEDRLEELRKELLSFWHSLREAKSLIILHFNKKSTHNAILENEFLGKEECLKRIDQLNEEIKNLIVQKHKDEDYYSQSLIKSLILTNKLMEEKDYQEISKDKEGIQKGLIALNFFTSNILKNTWEKVKRGEDRFYYTLKFSQIIFYIGIFIFIQIIALEFSMFLMNNLGKN